MPTICSDYATLSVAKNGRLGNGGAGKKFEQSPRKPIPARAKTWFVRQRRKARVCHIFLALRSKVPSVSSTRPGSAAAGDLAWMRLATGVGADKRNGIEITGKAGNITQRGTGSFHGILQ